MNETTLQRTFVALTDRLRQVPSAKLMGLKPHPAARDSMVASLQVPQGEQRLALRDVSESIYKDLGILVTFRTCEAS